MHECEGLWAIWVYLRLTGESLVWRLTEGEGEVSARRRFCTAGEKLADIDEEDSAQ